MIKIIYEEQHFEDEELVKAFQAEVDKNVFDDLDKLEKSLEAHCEWSRPSMKEQLEEAFASLKGVFMAELKNDAENSTAEPWWDGYFYRVNPKDKTIEAYFSRTRLKECMEACPEDYKDTPKGITKKEYQQLKSEIKKAA